MKWKSFACLAVGALMLMTVTQAVAAPAHPGTVFLAVDINGYNAGGGQAIGPTAAGYQGWEAAEGLFLDPSIDWGNSGAAGLTKIFPTSEGNITANLKGVAPSSFLGARNRGANAGALSDLTQDFVFSQRGLGGFGQNFIKLTLSGLTPGQQYEFTGYAREPFNGGTGADNPSVSFQAWTDLAALGGLDGPGAYMDANFDPDPALYQPVWVDIDDDMDPMTPANNDDGDPLNNDPPTNTGYKNPIPTLLRTQISGPDSSDPFAYSASFYTNADASGVATLYTWADPNSFSGVQAASLLNGFQLANLPEPTSLVLFALSLVGVISQRHRTR